MNEFTVIRKYFTSPSYERRDVLVGIGDDAAVTQVPKGQYLVTTTDTILEDVHFLANTDANAVAHKAVATNLSDLAAMGAEPSWLNISLTIPSVDDNWLSDFSERIRELAEYYAVQVIGGDTIKGKLSVTITAQGFVPPKSALTRGGAKKGDLIFVTGTLGDAAVGLQSRKGSISISDSEHKLYLENRYLYPTPRVLAGTTLRRIASSCIDISDGLLQDASHIANASNVGMLINLDNVPISKPLGESITNLDNALSYACTGGDDYELLFTVPEEHRTAVESSMASYDIPCTCIGLVTGAQGRIDLRLNDEPYEVNSASRGYAHFS